MLGALQAYYAEVRECVKTPEGMTDYFDSHLGVKQGCPLSPTLFGLYIDALEGHMMTAFPDSTVHIGSKRAPMLLYADDIVFMARSEGELQRMLDVFADFCQSYELTVNLDKTAVVVFGTQRNHVSTNVTYRGMLIQQEAQYKYLGIYFHSQIGALKGGSIMIALARKAVFAMQQQARAEEISSPALLCNMFDTLVAPILLYGCEIWGSNAALVEEANKLHTGFLKRVLKVPTSTDTWVILTELGRTPMAHRVLERQGAYWNRLAEMHGDRLLAHARMENFAWMVAGHRGDKKCWYTATLHHMNTVGMHLDGRNVSIPCQSLRNRLAHVGASALQTSITRGMADNRDLYGSDMYARVEGVRRRTYALWFWAPGQRPAHNRINHMHRRSLLLFRLGAHDLNVVTGARVRGISIPRLQRVCRCCRMDVVEDEAHLVFECPHYEVIRLGFSHIFCDDQVVHGGPQQHAVAITDTTSMMQRFFRQDNQAHVALFIYCCLKERRAYLEQHGGL
jgi:hypothetical protein